MGKNLFFLLSFGEKKRLVKTNYKIWLFWVNQLNILVNACRDPTVGPESLTLFLTTLFGKKGYFHLFPLTVSILSPLNLHYHVVNLIFSWISSLILWISNRLTTQFLLTHKVDTEDNAIQKVTKESIGIVLNRAIIVIK